MSWLLVALGGAGCAGPDSDPVEVAERFHAARVAADDAALHALLADADRAEIPLASFPAALPGGLALRLLGWGGVRLDSAGLLSSDGDTAIVVLHAAGARDTLQLVASQDPIGFGPLRLDRTRWRVSLRLPERARLDSLAATLRGHGKATDSAAIAAAQSYLAAAEQHPDLARPADRAAARATLRTAAVAESLRIELEIERSISGTSFVSGHVENPSDQRISTLELVVRDRRGQEERVEIWDIPGGTSTTVWHLSRLTVGPTDHRVERIEIF